MIKYSIFIAILSVFFLVSATCFAQITDTVKIDEILIQSSRTPLTYSESTRVVSITTKNEISIAPVSGIEDILKSGLHVDIRQRGVQGVQSDIGIRGGTFDQTLILLNGIKMNDPQTGHHSLNLPVCLEDINRIEILEGPGSRIYGPNAYSGAVNILTGSPHAKKINISIAGGSHSLYNTWISGSYYIGKFSNYLSFSRKASDGYIKNTDFDISNVYYQNELNTKIGNVSMQAGQMTKNFGANSFYTPEYPFQYEATRTQFASINFKAGKLVKINTSAYWRRHYDRFELFREGDGFYRQIPEYHIYQSVPSFWINQDIHDTIKWYTGHNYHLTDVGGIDFNLSFDSKLGKTALGVDLRSEHIYSNKLGVPMNVPIAVDGRNAEYTKSKGRENIGLFLQHDVNYKDISFSTGVFANRNSDYDWKIYSGFDVSYLINKHLKLFGSLNQSMRIPTFTDLYYEGPKNIGNPELKPEKALTGESGIKWSTKLVQTYFSTFYRKGSDVIAWVRLKSTDSWTTKNLTDVTASGVALSLNFTFQDYFGNRFPLRFLRMNYAWLSQNMDAGSYQSNYVIDNLKHKFTVAGECRLYKDFGISFNYNLQQRDGEYATYNKDTKKWGEITGFNPVSLLDARLFWQNKHIFLYLEAQNLLNVHYFDYGNIEMPGAWIQAGCKLSLNLKK
jgi:iron complex outermembrane receptor protein